MMIKSIPTFWNGRIFRSRTEARWAVFFDVLGIAYEYEKEGYQLSKGIWYLPDFWLTDLKFWVEIKPDIPNEVEIQKAHKLSANLGIPIYIATKPIGNTHPWPMKETKLIEYNYGDNPPEHWKFQGEEGICREDDNYLWTRCPGCGKYGIEFEGRSHRLCGCQAGSGKEGRDESRCNEILIAYNCALNERFDKPEPEIRLKPTGS
jgi:hypothetical protein